jgi:uncharacterized membrane protein
VCVTLLVVMCCNAAGSITGVLSNDLQLSQVCTALLHACMCAGMAAALAVMLPGMNACTSPGLGFSPHV